MKDRVFRVRKTWLGYVVDTASGEIVNGICVGFANTHFDLTLEQALEMLKKNLVDMKESDEINIKWEI